MIDLIVRWDLKAKVKTLSDVDLVDAREFVPVAQERSVSRPAWERIEMGRIAALLDEEIERRGLR